MTRSTLCYCLVFGAALLWLNGCAMLGPDFETPDAKSPSNWIEEDNELFLKPSEDDTLSWWSTFNDPTLDRLIELFSTQNLSLQTAAVRILEARAQLALE